MSKFVIPGSNNQPIFGDIHRPKSRPTAVVLLAHGFKGYKDYGFFPRLAHKIAARGMVAVRFNFSHSGMTNNIDTFERPDLFEQDTWGKQIDDLFTVASHIADSFDLSQVWFGHAATEGRTPAPNRIITAAAPDYGCNLDENVREILRRDGYLESPSGRTGQRLRIGRAWLDEIEADPDRFDPLKCISSLDCPVNICHGADDSTVSAAAAHRLSDAAKEHDGAVILAGAEHTFNCPNPHPAHEPGPPQTESMIDYVCAAAEHDFVLK